jgi:hypothetical protein
VGQLLLARNEFGNVEAAGEWTDSHQLDDVLGELPNVVNSAGVPDRLGSQHGWLSGGDGRCRAQVAGVP